MKAVVYQKYGPSAALNPKLFRTLGENRDRLMGSNGGCALWKKPKWIMSLLS